MKRRKGRRRRRRRRADGSETEEGEGGGGAKRLFFSLHEVQAECRANSFSLHEVDLCALLFSLHVFHLKNKI